MKRNHFETSSNSEYSLPSVHQLASLVELALSSTMQLRGLRGDEDRETGQSIIHQSDIESLSDSESPAYVQHHVGGRYQRSYETGLHTYTMHDAYSANRLNGMEYKTSTKYIFEWTDHQTITAIRNLDYSQKRRARQARQVTDSSYILPDFSVPNHINDMPDVWRAEAECQKVSSEDCEKLINDMAEYFDTIDRLVRK